jgi:predicted transcriptional regulator
MAKKKVNADRHRSKAMVRLDDEVHAQLKKLAERNNRPLSWEIKSILIKALERAGLWPGKK